MLLPYGAGTLLGHVLDTARACAFDQPLCVLGSQPEIPQHQEGLGLRGDDLRGNRAERDLG